METATIWFKNTSSDDNKQLTKFIETNLDSLIRKSKIKFNLKIVTQEDIVILKKHKIKKLPAMSYGANYYIGSHNIIKAFGAKRSGPELRCKDDNELLMDNMFNELTANMKVSDSGKNKMVTFADDDDKKEDDLSKRAAAEARRRGIDIGAEITFDEPVQKRSEGGYAKSSTNSGNPDDLIFNAMLGNLPLDDY